MLGAYLITTALLVPSSHYSLHGPCKGKFLKLVKKKYTVVIWTNPSIRISINSKIIKEAHTSASSNCFDKEAKKKIVASLIY